MYVLPSRHARHKLRPISFACPIHSAIRSRGRCASSVTLPITWPVASTCSGPTKPLSSEQVEATSHVIGHVTDDAHRPRDLIALCIGHAKEIGRSLWRACREGKTYIKTNKHY